MFVYTRAALLASYLLEHLWSMNIFRGTCQLYRFMIPPFFHPWLWSACYLRRVFFEYTHKRIRTSIASRVFDSRKGGKKGDEMKKPG